MEAGAMEAFNRGRQFDAKRRAVIVAAAQAFHVHGYVEASLDEVARRLSVTKKTLYYYVKSKNEILVELFHMWLDTQEASVAHAEQVDGNAIDKLSAYARHYVRSVLDLAAPIDRVASEISALSDDDRETIERRRNSNDNRLRKIMEGGINDGSLRPDMNIKVAHYTLHGAIDWFFKYYRPNGELTAERIVDEFMKILAEGMKPQKA